MKTIALGIAIALPIFAIGQEVDSLLIEFENNLNQEDLLEYVENNPDNLDLDILNEDFQKVNLNDLDLENIKSLNFLNVFEINNLYSYILKHRPVLDYFELLSVQGIDSVDLLMLKKHTFIEASNHNSPNSYWTNPKSKIVISSSYTQGKQGYRKLIKSQHKLSDNLEFAFNLENDAEEEFRKPFPYFDYASFYLELKNKNFVKKLIVGDYKCEFGQGLGLWTSYSMNYNYSDGPIKYPRGFVKNSGFTEANYQRGLAATFNLLNIEMSAFVSLRLVDAGLNHNQSSFANIHTTYIHPDGVDQSKWRNLERKDFGFAISKTWEFIKVDFIQSSTVFDKKFEPDGSKVLNPTLPVNQTHYTSYSLALQANLNNLLIGAEIQSSSLLMASPSLIINVLYNPSEEYSILLSRRIVQPSNFHFTQLRYRLNPTQGEDSYLANADLHILPNISISGYINSLKGLWYGYNTNFYHRESNIGLKIQYSYSSKIKASFNLSYRLQDEQTNRIDYMLKGTEEGKQIRYNFSHSIVLNNFFSYSTTAQIKTNSNKELKKSYLLQGKLSFKNKSVEILQILALFDAASWENRIYAYESDLLYSNPFMLFYGRGIKASTIFKTQISNYIDLSVKYSYTQYNNLSSLFDYNLGRSANKFFNLRAQLRIKF